MTYLRYVIRSKILILSMLTVIILGIASYKYFFSSKVKVLPPVLKVVEVTLVKEQPFQKTVRLLGTVQPKHTASLVAKGDGRLDVIIASGQTVKKGTLIAAIDNIDIETNLELSHSAANMAQARFKKLNSLSNTGYISKKEIEDKKQAWIDAAKEVSRMKIERDHLRIYAPFDGIVGAYLTRDGSDINKGTVVAQFFDPSEVVVDVDIPCSRYPAIRKGQKARVQGTLYQLAHMQTMINPKTHMCPADIDIDCQNCLLGETVDVDLVVQQSSSAIVIPYQARFLQNNEPFAYVIENNKVVLKSITTGMREQDLLEVTSGLVKGQQVVIKAQERLYPGLEVKTFAANKTNSKL